WPGLCYRPGRTRSAVMTGSATRRATRNSSSPTSKFRGPYDGRPNTSMCARNVQRSSAPSSPPWRRTAPADGRRCNMKIVVIGGTGISGKKLIPLLRQRGHEVVAASRSSGVNALTGEGLAEALAGAQVVVDVSNSPSFEDKAVLEFFQTSTRNLLAAEAVA